MGFLNGKASWLRFKVGGVPLTALVFGDDHLDRLRDPAAGRSKVASADGVEVGWAAGDSVLDTDFTPEKNVCPEHLLFDFLVEQDRIPGDLLRAYYQADLKALAANNPSGFASARQKREAKESARERLEVEAADGRFRRWKAVPVLWDARRGEVLFGVASLALVGRFAQLFEDTFAPAKLEFQGAGAVADRFLPGGLEGVWGHAPVVPREGEADVAWIADDASRDFLGNEFLAWLWWYTAEQSDTVPHDSGEITVMFSGTLSLECPRGMTGSEVFRHENPTRLPEAIRGAKAGKLPRKAGLTLVRHDRQYGVTLQAETFGCSGVSVPRSEDATDAVAARLDRLEAIRDAVEVVDDLVSVFCQTRTDAGKWADYLADARRWLGVTAPASA